MTESAEVVEFNPFSEEAVLTRLRRLFEYQMFDSCDLLGNSIFLTLLEKGYFQAAKMVLTQDESVLLVDCEDSRSVLAHVLWDYPDNIVNEVLQSAAYESLTDVEAYIELSSFLKRCVQFGEVTKRLSTIKLVLDTFDFYAKDDYLGVPLIYQAATWGSCELMAFLMQYDVPIPPSVRAIDLARSAFMEQFNPAPLSFMGYIEEEDRFSNMGSSLVWSDFREWWHLFYDFVFSVNTDLSQAHPYIQNPQLMSQWVTAWETQLRTGGELYARRPAGDLYLCKQYAPGLEDGFIGPDNLIAIGETPEGDLSEYRPIVGCETPSERPEDRGSVTFSFVSEDTFICNALQPNKVEKRLLLPSSSFELQMVEISSAYRKLARGVAD